MTYTVLRASSASRLPVPPGVQCSPSCSLKFDKSHLLISLSPLLSSLFTIYSMPKRSRAPIACDRCRAMKVKCTGEVPCARCKKFNISCSFAADEPAAPTKKIAPSAGISEEKGTSLGDYFYQSSQWETYGRTQAVLLLELCSTSAKDHFEGQSAPFKAPRIQGYGWNMSGVHYLQREEFSRPPDYDFAGSYEHLVEYFFKEINPLFNVLSQDFHQLFLTSFDRLLLPEGHTLTQKNIAHLHSSLLYLVLAVSLRFTEFQKPDGPHLEALQLENECFSYAHQVILAISFEFFSLETIQGWLLVVLYLRIAHSKRSLLNALDRANCMARNMGLHTVRATMSKEPAVRAKARMIFWSLYSMDQIFSIQIGRSPFWRNNEITLPLLDPTEVSKFDLEPENAYYAIHRLAVLANQVQVVRSGVLEEITVSLVGKSMEELHAWLHEGGYMTISNSGGLLPIIKAQVVLYFNDILFCFHSPVLFNYVGKSHHWDGNSLEKMLAGMEEVVGIFDKLQTSDLLVRPCNNNLAMLFSVGSFSLAFVNGGNQTARATRLFQSALNHLRFLGSLKVPEATEIPLFPMAKECVWALSQGINCLKARFEKELAVFLSFEVEKHSDDVNRRHFGNIGEYVKPNGESSDEEKDNSSINGAASTNGQERVRDIFLNITGATWMTEEIGMFFDDIFTDSLDII